MCVAELHGVIWVWALRRGPFAHGNLGNVLYFSFFPLQHAWARLHRELRRSRSFRYGVLWRVACAVVVLTRDTRGREERRTVASFKS